MTMTQSFDDDFVATLARLSQRIVDSEADGAYRHFDVGVVGGP